VGGQGISRWNGSLWYRVPTPSLGSGLRAVWGAAANDVWAVGLGGIAVHWDGSSWQRKDTGVDENMYAMSGSGREVWATGEWYVMHFDGAKWSIAYDGAFMGERYGAIHAAGPNDVWASGSRLLRWNGARWDTLMGLEAPKTFTGREGRLWGLSSSGRILRWDGAVWRLSFECPLTLNRIWAAPTGEVFAAGHEAIVMRRSDR
jgi:hypothetical protein